MSKIFVTGIGTEIGKTFCSAILVEALKADYWKPLQAGELDNLDSDWVRKSISNSETVIHPEKYLLTSPMSPHAAARIDNIKIDIADFETPETANENLIIEGAGGLLVPLNDDKQTVIDLIPAVADEVILISQNYLGSINHTLLSVEALKARNIPIRGIVFNGERNWETESLVISTTGIKCIGKVPQMKNENLKDFIKTQARQLDI